MDIKKIMTTRNAKILLVVFCAVALKYRRVVAEDVGSRETSNIAEGSVGSDAPWFKQNLTLGDVKAALNDYPQRIDEVNWVGLTGLMYAINLGYVEIAEEFMKRGASLDMTAKNKEKNKDNERFYRSTALHIALLNANDDKSFKMAKDLIFGIKKDDGTMTQKANVLLKNGFGFTPLHTVAASVSLGQDQRDDAQNRPYQLIVMLVDAAGNEDVQRGYLNAQDNNGNTMLHLLAQTNSLILIEKLIEKYGRWIKLDIKNNPTKDPETQQERPGLTPAELAKLSGYGTACGTRLDVELTRYNNKSITEDEYKHNPKFNDIPPA